MHYLGNLRKMVANLADDVQYSLVLNEQLINLNQYIGKDLTLRHTGKINCIACGVCSKKSYQQGYCYPCSRKLAACDLCILKPETCHYHKGTCRQPAWGLQHCFVPHIVYLANSSGVKVGITRESQIPTRWIDQGAVQALPIIRTKSRYQAGLLEVVLAKFVTDKTNWRKMLQGNIPAVALDESRDNLFAKVAADIQEISGKFPLGNIELLTREKIITIDFPVLQYPNPISTLNFTKQASISGTLLGIKGQYLIFPQGGLNIRSCAGFEIEFSVAS